MNKNILYISVILNIVLVVAIGLHWRYIAMKYNVMHTPPLPCDRLRFAYLLNNDAVFVPADDFFEKNPDAKTMPEDVRRSLIFSDLVNEQSQQIEDICNAELQMRE